MASTEVLAPIPLVIVDFANHGNVLKVNLTSDAPVSQLEDKVFNHFLVPSHAQCLVCGGKKLESDTFLSTYSTIQRYVSAYLSLSTSDPKTERTPKDVLVYLLTRPFDTLQINFINFGCKKITFNSIYVNMTVKRLRKVLTDYLIKLFTEDKIALQQGRRRQKIFSCSKVLGYSSLEELERQADSICLFYNETLLEDNRTLDSYGMRKKVRIFVNS